MWTRNWRDQVWLKLSTPWDMIVIGGGVTGAGIFLEAVRVGLRTLLLDANDFAYGTSSRSSKLIHGGFRYLKNRQFSVTKASVVQRERLIKEAPGLVKPLSFVYPHYHQKESWMIEAGLAVYDLMGHKWEHKRLSAQKIIQSYPFINYTGLVGGHLYQDANIDDARFVFRLIREGVLLGGVALNYAPVVELLYRINGRITGVRVDDVSTGISSRTIEIHAPVIVNATGPWTDDLRVMAGKEKRIRKLRGSHLVFTNQRVPIVDAVTITHPRDKRMMFAIPWETCTIIGTTDLDHPPEFENLKSEPFITGDEFEYILEAARNTFPFLSLQAGDVISTFAGLRPIITSGERIPSKESRGHAVFDDDGLFTITGGKFTTYRLMADDLLQRITPYLKQQVHFQKSTPVLSLSPRFDHFPGELAHSQISRFCGRYGTEVEQFILESDPDELPSLENSNICQADLRWAARNEGVVHLDDLLLRRTRLGLTNPKECHLLIDEIRNIMLNESGWDEYRWNEEIANYTKLWEDCYAPLV